MKFEGLTRPTGATMDAILEMLNRGAEQLLGRTVGPLQFRFLVMPTVVTLIAIRAGLKDVREGRPAFLWDVISNSADRRARLLAGWKDITRVFIMAMVLDTLYQITMLRAFYVLQALIVAVGCAIMPYLLFRGPTARLTRLLGRRRGEPTVGKPAAEPTEQDTIPVIGSSGNQHALGSGQDELAASESSWDRDGTGEPEEK